MTNRKIFAGLSQTYLCIVPILTALLGFTVKNVHYNVYLPIWIINVFLMLTACRILGANYITTKNKENKHLVLSGLLLLSPWLLYSIFAGMGSPPETYAQWVSNAFEQQVRYSFLIAGGVFLILGFAVLRESTKSTSGNLFSLLGFTTIVIAMTLFILNMIYWHSFLPEVFKTKEAVLSNKLPEWFQPVKKYFLVVSIVEVSLTYLGTAAFAASIESAGWFKNGASWVYILISLLAFILVALYGFYPEAVIANGFPFYPFMIPAIPFAIPYYIGVNLLRGTKMNIEESVDNEEKY